MTNGRVLRAEGIPRRCVLSESIAAGLHPSLSKLPPVACELRLFYQSVTTQPHPCISLILELPVDAYVGLPFFMPIAAKGAFRIGIEIGTVVDAVRTAEAGFVPGTTVVVGQVHRFSIGCGQVETAVTAEFVEDRGFISLGFYCLRKKSTLNVHICQ